MSDKKPAPKLNSYSLLQMKMKEVEKSRNPDRPATKSSTSSNHKDKESKERKNPPQRKPPPPDPSKEQHRLNPNIPDRSFGDYFCKICDSHMNSDAMWEAHTTGKRHIKNVKKGDTDSKYDELDEESSIKFELQNVNDPIIGLNYIHEIRRKDPNIPAMYNCFLCHASIATVPLVVEHVIGLKHRLNYIKENETEEYDLIESTGLKKNNLEPLVAEAAAKLEAKSGRGEVKVKVEKPKPAIPYKRSYDSDDDDDRVASKKTSKPYKSEEKVPVWSYLDTSKRNDRETDDRRRDTDYYHDGNRSRNIVSHRSYRSSVSPDRDYSRRSERDSYSRSYVDDYSSRSISHPIDYLRSERSELSRYSYDRSPDRDRPSTSTRKDDYYTSSFSRSRLSDSHSFKAEMAASIGESSARQSIDPSSMLKDFISQLKNLPTEYFLKIVLMKLQDMSDLSKVETDLLMKVFYNAQHTICNSLPSHLRVLFKDKIIQSSSEIQVSGNAANSSASNTGHSSAAQPRMPQGGQSAEDMSNKFVNDINDLLFGARKASENSSSDNQQTRLNVYDRSPNIASASSHYPRSASTNFPPPPSFQPQSSNFALPPSNFQQSSSNFPSASNNFPPPPARFHPPPPARFHPPPNEFSSRTNNTPSEFLSKSNNAASSYSSYAPYDTSLPSSGIPGLTLTEHDNSQYKWTAPNSNNRDLSNFRRY